MDPIGGGAWAVRLVGGSQQSAVDALADLRAAGLFAEHDLVRRPCLTPNDPIYPLQWGARAIRLEEAWDRTTGSTSVVVAVVDTGILAGHPDLQGQLLPGRDFISSPLPAGDGDGWDADPNDEGHEGLGSSGFHGTLVAGVVAAVANNGNGVAGASWRSPVVPVRALGVSDGKGVDADIAPAIRWAAGLEVPGAPSNPNPARVIVLGFGGFSYNQALADAVAAALARGAIIVAGAGNLAGNAADIYPASLPGVICVGAVDHAGKPAPYTNHGAAVTIMAPGGDLLQTLPFQFGGKSYPAGIISTFQRSQAWGYHMQEGTSCAAAYVAGVISLMLARDASLTASEVKQLLVSTANPAGKCDKGCGAGLVDAAAALAALDEPLCPDCSPSPFPRGCSCHLHGPLPADDAGVVALVGLLVVLVLRLRRLKSG